MANKKNLGMGLDLLLTAVDERTIKSKNKMVLTRARTLFARAITEDEKGNLFEAYHLYRQVMECLEQPLSIDLSELHLLVSQSLNNIAIILYDSGRTDLAGTFLSKALELCPDNQTARENYQIISQVDIDI